MKTFCSMHTHMVSEVMSVQNQFRVLQKDLLAVVVDLQSALAKSTEQLTKCALELRAVQVSKRGTRRG